MFDIVKFGKALSRLRKKADMTQNEVADRLNLSRQAVSKYERGESFPDISVLVVIAEMFGITLDRLISFGEPTAGESLILKSVAQGDKDVAAGSAADVVNLAPLLKPSVLAGLSAKLAEKGINIAYLIALAEYINDESFVRLLEKSSLDGISDELLEKLIPILDFGSREAIFHRILDGEIDWHFIKVLLPYADYLTSQIEAAVLAGVLPWEVMDILSRYCWVGNKNRQDSQTD